MEKGGRWGDAADAACGREWETTGDLEDAAARVLVGGRVEREACSWRTAGTYGGCRSRDRPRHSSIATSRREARVTRKLRLRLGPCALGKDRMTVEAGHLAIPTPLAEVVLASASPWRQRILQDAGIRCIATASDLDEDAIGGATPPEVARNRALAKARAVSALHPTALVIGADQVVHLDGEAIGKPESNESWLVRLRSFRGRTHRLTTAVALVSDGQPAEVFAVESLVRFRTDCSDEELQAYVVHGEARGCAGGYMVERRGVWLVEAIDGDWTNVVGLPVFELVRRLRARGWRLHPDGFARPTTLAEALP